MSKETPAKAAAGSREALTRFELVLKETLAKAAAASEKLTTEFATAPEEVPEPAAVSEKAPVMPAVIAPETSAMAPVMTTEPPTKTEFWPIEATAETAAISFEVVLPRRGTPGKEHDAGHK
jgi:hypothetical protein